jgi:hypothetical protein
MNTSASLPLAARPLAAASWGASLAALAIAFAAGCGGSGGDAASTEAAAKTAASRETAAATANPEKLAQMEAERTSRDATPPAARDATTPPAARSATPPLRPDPPMLDFGIVPPGQESVGSVRLVNAGSEPLTILAVQPTCKCTAINDLEGRVIPAGESIELEAKLDAVNAPGSRSASVRVLVDGYTEPVTVQLKSAVALPIRVSPPYINAVEGKNPTGRLVVQSNDGMPFRICSAHGRPPRYIGFDPATDEPQNRYFIQYDLADIDTGGTLPRYWIIETDREDSPVVDVLLRHERSMPKFTLRMKDYRLIAGSIAPGGSAEFQARLDVRPDPVEAAMSRSPDGQVELLGSSLEDGLTVLNLRLTPAAGHSGFLHVPFTLITRSGEQQDLEVFATVRSPGSGCGAAAAATSDASGG